MEILDDIKNQFMKMSNISVISATKIVLICINMSEESMEIPKKKIFNANSVARTSLRKDI